MELTFEGFEFAPRFDNPKSQAFNKCFNETVEIRANTEFSGEIFCGTDLKPGTKIISRNGKVILIVIANDEKLGKGLKASVKFISVNEPESQNNKTITSRIMSLIQRILGIKPSTTVNDKTKIIYPSSTTSTPTLVSQRSNLTKASKSTAFSFLSNSSNTILSSTATPDRIKQLTLERISNLIKSSNLMKNLKESKESDILNTEEKKLKKIFEKISSTLSLY